mmetsp:Transcript_77175/g.218273  ORF Transcript_77175/g.218273 Transcript_77175/m.218273 type:complete len:214 (-) Transcript_77175:628-1269(-)
MTPRRTWFCAAKLRRLAPRRFITNATWMRINTHPQIIMMLTLMRNRASGRVLMTHVRRRVSMSKTKIRMNLKTSFMGDSHSMLNDARMPNCCMVVMAMPPAIAIANTPWPCTVMSCFSTTTYTPEISTITITQARAKTHLSPPPHSAQEPSGCSFFMSSHSAHVRSMRPGMHVWPGGPPLQRRKLPWQRNTDRLPSASGASEKYPASIEMSSM